MVGAAGMVHGKTGGGESSRGSDCDGLLMSRSGTYTQILAKEGADSSHFENGMVRT